MAAAVVGAIQRRVTASGSCIETSNRGRFVRAAGGAECVDGVGERELFADVTRDEATAANLAARFEATIRAQ